LKHTEAYKANNLSCAVALRSQYWMLCLVC